MVSNEENMPNLQDLETRVTIGESGTIIGGNLAIGMADRNLIKKSIV